MPCQIGNPNSIFPDFSCSKPRIWNIWWVMLAFHKKIVVYTSQIMKSTLSSGWWHLCWLHDPKKPTSGTIHSTTTWGMASKFSPMPIWATSTSGNFFKKKTSILTNSAALWRRFDGKICESDHQHQKIEGCEQGHKRSQLAQVYPDGMCSAIASAVMQEASGATGF